MPEFVNARQAAKLLGVNHVTIWRWIARGKIKDHRIPGKKECRIEVKSLPISRVQWDAMLAAKSLAS
jgi:excisionase family DNA binding protein